MSRSRLLSGKVPKKSGSELDSSRYEFLDIANAEPDLGTPNFDGAMLISNSDGSRFWTDNIRIDLTGNIAVGTISSADGSTPVTFVDNVLVEDDLTVQGGLFSPIVTTQTINTIDSSNLRIESGLIVEGDLIVQGTTTTINSTTLAIEDKNIELAKGANTAGEADGAGITVLGPDTPASLTYDALTDSWAFNKDIRADLIGSVTGDIFTNRIESPDSSEITVNSSVSVDGDLRVNNDINAGGTVYAERVFVRDTIVGTFEGAITGPEATGLFQQLITSGIDSLDSSPIRFIPGIIVESDLTVENNIYVDQDITAQRNITAENFYGTLRGNVKIDSGVSEFNDIRIKGVLIGDVLTAISAGNLQGDILSENGVKVLENGTDGTDAAFTGSVTGDIFTNRIESPDSSELTINTSVSIDGDLRVDNDINAQGTVYAERVFVRDTIVGTFEGAITGPEATGLFQQLITSGIDSLDSSPIRFIPGILVESDLTVENNGYFQNDLTVSRDVTAQRFIGFLQGQVSDISNHSIGELSDVDITILPLNNQTLVWNALENKFVPGDSFSQADFDTAFGNKSIGDLSDVDTTTTPPTDGQALIWDDVSGKFIPGQPIGVGDNVEFSSITADIFTNSIDSPDSSAITIVPQVIMNSDLNVENNVYVTVDVTARKFLGDLYAQIVKSTFGEFDTITVNGVQIGAIQGSTRGNLIGDIFSENNVKILENGTDGTDATFTGSVIGNVTGQVSDISNHSIDALSDVDITTVAPSNGQTLVWNAASSKFIPGGQGVGTTDDVTFNSLTLESLDVVTIGSPDSTSISVVNSTVFASDVTVDNNLVVQGNLTVLGTETIISSESLIVSDPIIYFAEGNQANVLDIGIAGSFNNGVYQHTGLIRDASDNIWRLFSNYLPEPVEPLDFTNVTYDDLKLGTLIADQINSQYIYGEIITNLIDSADSSPITVTPKLVTSSDLEVQGGLVVGTTAVIGESVSSSRFIGNLEGNVTGQISDISNHSLGDLGDVDLEISIPQDLDILTWNAGVQRWVASGLSNQGLFTTSDVTFNSLTATIYTNYIQAPDSGDIVAANRFIGTHDIVSENNIYSQNDIIATRNVEAEKFVGYLDGTARDIDDTALTNKEFATELDINLDQVFVYDVSAGELKKTYLSEIVSSGAAGYTGSQGDLGYTGSQGDLGYTGSVGYTGSQGGILFDFSVVGSAYRVTGLPGDFPIINVTRGQLYYFDFSNVPSTDPLALRLDTGDTSIVPGTEGNDPVSGTNGNLVVYRVPLDAPNFIVYQGTANPSWIGLINVFDQVGYTGSAGFTGSFGFTGSQGDQGYTGSAGLDGYTGSKGDDGTSIKIVGIVPTANDLPDPYNGDVGDGYIVADTGNLWTWSGSAWAEVGRILGYTGSQGPAGGYTGSKGDPGVAASFTTRAYTGDGSTTEFEITEANTIQTILVFLNGVNQRPTDDYTVSGSILTFAAAPSAGELIIIREMPQAATGYTGSQGNDGLGILDVEIVDDDLVITYQDSTQDNVGRVVGYTGSQGIPGEAAAIGYTGSQGDVGFTGSQGDVGFTGSQGDQGFTGSQGPQGASTEIKGSVATEADLPGNGRTFVFQSPGFYYNIDGISGENPQITLVRGRTYVFNFESVSSDHPIALRIAAGNIVPVPGTTGNDPQNGVFGPGAIVTYVVPLDAQSSIVYQCVNHPTMIGTIQIVDETVFNDLGDGYIVESTGDLWFWNGTLWNNVGKITGDLGPRGYTGSKGDDGQGILDVEIVDEDLIITFQDSTQENIGRVVGYTGSKGLGLDPWTRVTSNYTAESGNRIIADTTEGSFTLTLPPSPSLGSYVVLTDGGDWGVNPLVISAGGASIEGILNDIGLDIGGITLEFLWDGNIWHITATLGTEGAPGIGVPEGGTTGQVLAKASNDDYDTVWVNAATGGGNLGSLVIDGSRITTSDSSQIVVDERFKIEQDLSMGGDILPVTDSQFDLGSPSNKWRSLYVSSDTIFINDVPLTVNEGGELLVNGILPASSVPSITAINDIVLSSPTVGQVLGFTGSVWTNQSVAASQVSRFINLTITGEINPPRIGTFRFYPPQSIVITKVYASISTQAQGGAFTFQINKNGVNTGANLSISEGFFTMTPVITSISVNSSDYLTVDVTGVGSRDLHIKLEYEPAS